MIEAKTCINVYSNINTWIDFMIITDNPGNTKQAKEIIETAYNDWFDDVEGSYEPIGDYISRKLYENGIEFDIYFKNNDEER